MHALEKYKKAGPKDKGSFDPDAEDDFLETPREKDPEDMRKEIESEFQNIRSQARRSNLVETFKKVDSTMDKFQKKNIVSKMFNELSSIAVDHDDLPQNIKAFAADTFDGKVTNEINIPSTLSKGPQTHRNMNIKANKVMDYQNSSRRDKL